MSKQVETVPVAGEGADTAVVTGQGSDVPVVDRGLVAQLVGEAQRPGLPVDGEGGLLAELTRLVVESALEGEITDHLGYDKHERGGSVDGNARNGTRTKTVLSKAGPGPGRCPAGPCRHLRAEDRREAAASGSGRSRTSCCRCRRGG